MGPKKEEGKWSFNPFSSGAREEPPLTIGKRLKLFIAVHWRGVAVLFLPIIWTFVFWVSLPIAKSQYVGYLLLVMASFWVTECLPLAITAIIPVAVFPLFDIMSTRECCLRYMNDTIMMFLGSLVISNSVEQSCLHRRMAYCAIQSIGYSHLRLLLAMCCVTCFASMWITNTAATTMMVPINFALLKVFEDQGVLKLYDKSADGDLTASDVTSSYFCAVTYSATCGGIGTIVGTGTNLVFKGFMAQKTDIEYLSFPLFSAFGVPFMILIESFVYLWFAVVFFGFLRPASTAAKKSVIPKVVQEAAAAVIDKDVKKKGSISYWEGMVVILFGGAMLLFFCRSPQMFKGWGDLLSAYFGKDGRFIRDSALAMIVSFVMFLLPRDKIFFGNFFAKFKDELPKGRSQSILDWPILNAQTPYAFSFLLGGGFSLSQAADTSGLNANLGNFMKTSLENLPPKIILLVIIISVVLITNFASNVAVCTVFTPIVMELAENIKVHPLYYCVASGFAASFCFMIPVGTPGNLIVQSKARVSTQKMIKCGFGPTVSTVLITWLIMMFYAPIVWSDLNDFNKFVERQQP